jgi:hypothetical protein
MRLVRVAKAGDGLFPLSTKSLAANQASPNASAHDALKHNAEDVAVAEALIARMREC